MSGEAIKVLYDIQTDLAVVKTEVKSLKEDIENFSQEAKTRSSTIKEDVMQKIAELKARQDVLEERVHHLEGKDNSKIVKRYKSIMQILVGAVTAIFVVKFPELLKAIIGVFNG